MLKLILGAAGSGKTALITNEIRQRAARGEKGLYLIVPEQFSHEAERELCALCGDSFSLHAEVLSFSRLAVRVAQETGTGGAVSLDAGGRLLCMTLALGQIGGSLRVYKGAQRKPELQSSLLAAVSQLKAAGIGAQSLRDAMQNASGALLDKLYDLALCLETYDAVLAQGYADPSDKLLRLAQTVSKSSVGSGGAIYLDGFTDFTGAEQQVIKALAAKGAELTVCLTCDGADSENEHFAPAAAAARGLLSMGEEKGIKTQVIMAQGDADKAPELRVLGEGLFRFTAESAEGGDRIAIYRCASIRDECEMAAARCLELTEQGCRRRDIAIAVRGFSAYGAALEDTFALYGIPIFTARRESILQKPVPVLISAAFDAVSTGYDTDAVISYIKTGLTPLTREECDALEDYARRFGLRSGAWTQKKPWSQHPDGLSAEFDERSRERLDGLESSRKRLIAPLKALENAQKSAKTAQEQARSLTDFFAAIALPATLEKRAEQLQAAGYEQLAAEYGRLWDVVVKALEQFAAVLGEAPMTGAEFQKLYLRLLSQYDVSVIPVSADSVSAGDMDRMRRRKIKHLILLGASDDRLPAAIQSGGIFSDAEREELNALGVKLGAGGDELSRELSLIYNCITLPSESITISWPAADASGAECRPSFPVLRARALFGIKDRRFNRNEARLCAREPAYLLAAEYAGGRGGSRLAYDFFSSDSEGRKRLDALAEKSRRSRGKLSETAVKTLYGEKLSISPSRADTFSACRFQYFLRYGLRLAEREKSGLDAPELGSFMHYVLENTAGELSKSGGFKDVSGERINVLCDKYIEKYTAERLNGLVDKSPRFVYLFKRLAPSVRRVVADMVRELSLSDFTPRDFELSFMRDGELPPVTISEGGRELKINGIADRIDGYEKDGRLYLRVIDYKTGKKTFSFTDVWNGMGLQMLLYLFALEREGKERYGMKVAPAGVLYVPAHDVLVSAPGDLSDEELEKLKRKRLKRSGLILADREIVGAMESGQSPEYIPVKYGKDGELSGESLASRERLELLGEHVQRRMLELCENIINGRIEAEPYYKGDSENACVFCPYESVCRFDEERDKRRYLAKVEPEEFWKRLEEKA